MQHLVNWIEIPARNITRAKKFYHSILGFEMEETEMFGSKMAFFPTDGSNVAGALVQGEDYAPSTSGALVYLNGGDDLAVALSKVEKAGGQVIVPKTQISAEMGYFGIFIDSEGNKIALHSTK